jgi:hypothetical protein
VELFQGTVPRYLLNDPQGNPGIRHLGERRSPKAVRAYPFDFSTSAGTAKEPHGGIVTQVTLFPWSHFVSGEEPKGISARRVRLKAKAQIFDDRYCTGRELPLRVPLPKGHLRAHPPLHVVHVPLCQGYGFVHPARGKEHHGIERPISGGRVLVGEKEFEVMGGEDFGTPVTVYLQ